MNKWKLTIVGVITVVVAVFMMGCSDTGTPVPEDPPEEEVATWIDVVPGQFYRVASIGIPQTRQSFDDVTDYSDNYIEFALDGSIILWFDADADGILCPEELVDDEGYWIYESSVVEANGGELRIVDVSDDGWSGYMDTILVEVIDGECTEIAIPAEKLITYERVNPVYMTPDMLIITTFNVVYDDMGDVMYTYHHPRVSLDLYDYIAFSFGESDFILYNADFYGYKKSAVWIDGDIFFFDSNFEANEVYDVEISVQPNDVGYITAVSRNDGDVITAEIEVEYDTLGTVELFMVNDADTNLM